MRIHSKIPVFLLAVFITFGLSCSKFEDGPKISLLSKNKRISREWKVEYNLNLATKIEHSADFAGWLLSFKSDGTYSNIIIYDQTQTTTTGSWALVGDNQLRLNFNTAAGEQIEFYTILRLTSNELWLKNEFEEIHYFTD